MSPMPLSQRQTLQSMPLRRVWSRLHSTLTDSSFGGQDHAGAAGLLWLWRIRAHSAVRQMCLEEDVMRNFVHAVAVSFACVLTLAPRTALAQTQTPAPAPTPAQTPAPKPASLITYRGMESGFDVTAG